MKDVYECIFMFYAYRYILIHTFILNFSILKTKKVLIKLLKIENAFKNYVNKI